MLDDALWTPGMSCAIIAHERETLDKLFQIVKRAVDGIPEAIQPVKKTDTIRTYRFQKTFDGHKLDSEIYVALKLRGGTVQRLHITESAFIKDREELKIGSKQAVPKTGYISEETTGNGMEGFYDDYMDSLEKYQKGMLTEMDYMPYFYGWFENPEYSLTGELPELTEESKARYGDEEKMRGEYSLTDGQLLWRRWKLDEIRSNAAGAGLNVFQRFMQEYPATILEAFQSGVGNVFNLQQLMAQFAKAPLDPLMAYKLLTQQWEAQSAQERADNMKKRDSFNLFHKVGVNIWRLPTIGIKYIAGVDPSGGEGSDNTCIDIWEKETLVQVAQYYGKIRPDQGADLAADLCNFYNKAFIGVENNMLSFILFLSKIYDNYFTEVEIDKRTQRRTVKLGWNTNTKTRDPMIDDFVMLYEEDKVTINSNVTVSEMKTFVKKDNGKREHADGKHDDSLIAAMIAIQMRKFEPKHGRVFYNKPQGF